MGSVARTKKIYTTSFDSQSKRFRIIYFAIAWAQALSIPIFLAGQTTGLFFYDRAAQYGLQEPASEVGPGIVQVNRAFCASDTILYIPILITSAYGLFHKKRWSLICTAASAGMHSYWAATVSFAFLFLAKNDVEGYTHEVPLTVWGFIFFYLVFGILVLEYLYYYWETLLRVMS